MEQRFDTLTFLSDYGLGDEFVGVVKSVVRSIAPGVTVVDLTHDVPAFDVRAGGLTLARSAQYLCPGVVLAVVDPGVGTDRRAVAVEVGDGASVLVGPDNGLLAPAVAMVGGATRVVELTDPRYRLDSPGATFDGRDVFGPAAAHLCAGVPITELGPEIDATSLRPGLLPLSRVEDGVQLADVLWVDRFGNCQLNLDPDELDPATAKWRITHRGRARNARRVRAFAELATGELGLVLDSYGLLALAFDRSPAAEELDLAAGDQISLEPADDEPDAPDGPVTSPVTLRGMPR
ncbi:MAG: SAM-dependent chlorinase/fluorinase [Actinomycetota bacterium]|nr:SAM-dependent chlorinase/fluorinase [Actinomycetota bacterium]